MKLNLDCIPCFQRQALQAVRFISDDEELHQKVLREVAEKLLESNWDATPPELAHEVHRIVKRLTNESDPYREVKKESNDAVLKMYPALKKRALIDKNLRYSIKHNAHCHPLAQRLLCKKQSL
jgi:uncharacterized protein with ATP-grasp and redox domains